ncbi:MAG: DJ-1/PfpI family protein [Desulfurococcales archaeon]|nr:DJ-1/PfpI family protein [Desulfurococcales archaeon]
MNAPRILMIIGDGAEELEVFYPYYRFKEEGFTVHTAAPSKKEVHTVIHERVPDWDTYIEKPGRIFPWVDKVLDEVDPSEYDVVYIPGGRLPEYIRLYPKVGEILRHFMENNKIIVAVCHGGQVLAAYGLLKGKKVTGYIGIKHEVENSGAKFIDTDVVVDGNIVTGKTWRELPSIMKEVIRVIKERTGK